MGIDKELQRQFGIYLQRELNYCLRRFDFETSLKWREQILANKEQILKAIKDDLNHKNQRWNQNRKLLEN